MEITIHDSSKLCEIQEEFCKHFPYLKLEFFKSHPLEKENFSKENIITDTTKKLADVRHIHRTGNISINGHQKVSTLEQHFKEHFGISLQVFRKSGNTWLQTTVTDDWTLAEQNKKGQEMSTIISEQAASDYDEYHEQQ